jgi:hypothetical protein
MTSPLSNRRPAPDAPAPTAAGSPEPEPAWLALVAEKARSMHFGIIQIVVHDSRVVQVERTERTRFSVSGQEDAH